jgi:hypothetical protein
MIASPGRQTAQYRRGCSNSAYFEIQYFDEPGESTASQPCASRFTPTVEEKEIRKYSKQS